MSDPTKPKRDYHGPEPVSPQELKKCLNEIEKGILRSNHDGGESGVSRRGKDDPEDDDGE